MKIKVFVIQIYLLKILKCYNLINIKNLTILIYADLECIIEKIDGYKNNPQISSAAKVSEQIPSGSSMSTILSFTSVENENDICRGKDCMKNFCESLREHAMKITNFKT